MNFWANRSVFITGHTGFKGSWLTMLLSRKKAILSGYSLRNSEQNNLYLKSGAKHHYKYCFQGDIQNMELLSKAIETAQPSVIFHLAAQPIVSKSIIDPIDTIKTNIMGTTALLEVIKQYKKPLLVLIASSDKVYDAENYFEPFTENSPLGGNDPYSASKACVEHLVRAYDESFFNEGPHKFATARAGNVIGGGDNAQDRLIPDCLRSIKSKTTLRVRNPGAIRPWQHVLDPLTGYLNLIEYLYNRKKSRLSSWNFGPSTAQVKSVKWVLDYFKSHCNDLSWETYSSDVRETDKLLINSSKANKLLGWQPKLSIDKALNFVIEWHRRVEDGEPMNKVSYDQIDSFFSLGIHAK